MRRRSTDAYGAQKVIAHLPAHAAEQFDECRTVCAPDHLLEMASVTMTAIQWAKQQSAHLANLRSRASVKLSLEKEKRAALIRDGFKPDVMSKMMGRMRAELDDALGFEVPEVTEPAIDPVGIPEVQVDDPDDHELESHAEHDTVRAAAEALSQWQQSSPSVEGSSAFESVDDEVTSETSADFTNLEANMSYAYLGTSSAPATTASFRRFEEVVKEVALPDTEATIGDASRPAAFVSRRSSILPPPPTMTVRTAANVELHGEASAREARLPPRPPPANVDRKASLGANLRARPVVRRLELITPGSERTASRDTTPDVLSSSGRDTSNVNSFGASPSRGGATPRDAASEHHEISFANVDRSKDLLTVNIGDSSAASLMMSTAVGSNGPSSPLQPRHMTTRRQYERRLQRQAHQRRMEDEIRAAEEQRLQKNYIDKMNGSVMAALAGYDVDRNRVLITFDASDVPRYSVLHPLVHVKECEYEEVPDSVRLRILQHESTAAAAGRQLVEPGHGSSTGSMSGAQAVAAAMRERGERLMNVATSSNHTNLSSVARHALVRREANPVRANVSAGSAAGSRPSQAYQASPTIGMVADHHGRRLFYSPRRRVGGEAEATPVRSVARLADAARADNGRQQKQASALSTAAGKPGSHNRWTDTMLTLDDSVTTAYASVTTNVEKESKLLQLEK